MGDALSFAKDTMTDVIDVVTTPFREVMKMITGTVSDVAQTSVDTITGVVHGTGLDDIASGVVDGIGSAAGSVLDTGENILNKGSDSIFGTLDVVKYVPYVIVGFVGLFGLKFGAEMIGEAGKTARARR